jgi:hypothetical protein
MITKRNLKVELKNRFLILFLFLLLFFSESFSQKKYDKDFYGGIFFISDYIASQGFQNLKTNHADIDLVDSIYCKALIFFEGDISEALLCLTFSTIPFNHITIKLPVIGSNVIAHLPSPGKKVFQKRRDNLPKKIFIDSPNDDFGDKDKLAHFFGNAFLSYNLGWFNFSKFIGMFVEKIEDGFFAEGGFDRRDLIINSYGDFFGKLLKNNHGMKPSNVLKIHQLIYFRLTP